MGILGTTGTPPLARAATFLDPASDWTVGFWVHSPAVLSGVTAWLLGDATYAGPFIGFGNVDDANHVFGFMYDGTTYEETTHVSVPPADWWYFTAVYKAGTNDVTFYVNHVSIGVFSGFDLTAFGAGFATENLGGDGGGPSLLAVEYARTWQAALSLAEITAESTSVSPVRTTNLLAASRLAAFSVVTDPVGGHNWTSSGAATYLSGPLPPPNLTPSTARTLVPDVPVTIDVEDAPQNAGWPSTCDANGYHGVWFKYTTGLTQRTIAFSADIGAEVGSFYNPYVSVWNGPIGALTQYRILSPGNTQNFCGGLAGDNWFEIPVAAATTYYFQVADQNNTSPLETALTVTLKVPTASAAPIGSFVISDDSDGYGAVVLDAVTGAFLQIRPFPAGEFTEILPTGEICTQDGEADTAVAVLDAAWNRVATVDFTPALIHGIKSDLSGTFYVFTNPSGSLVTTVHAVSKLGVVGATWTLPVSTAINTQFAVSRNGNTLYYGANQVSSVVKAYDLAGSAALPNLHAAFGTEHLSGLGDGFVDVDGNIWFGYSSNGGGASGKLRQFSPAGAVLQTVVVSSGLITLLNHFAWAGDAPGAILVWGNDGGVNPAYFRFIAISDGSTIRNVPAVPVTGASGEPPRHSPFAISNSCPVFVLPVALSFGGSLVIEKVTVPGGDPTLFSFVVTGDGLTDFTLRDGDFLGFTGLTPGDGYGVDEDPQPGYTTTYETSNDSPHDNIAIGDGEAVVLTVTNTFSAVPPSPFPPPPPPPSPGTPPPFGPPIPTASIELGRYDIVFHGVRRVRRAPHLSNEQRRIFYPAIQVDLQPGIGNRAQPGLNPIVMLRISRDGGLSFGPEIWMTAGLLGEYTRRVIARNLGYGRDVVFEVIVSDPNNWNLIGAYFDPAPIVGKF